MKPVPGSSNSLLDLQWSEARWQAILDTARDAIISIDRQGTVTLFNRAAEEIFAYTAEEVLGRNVSMLMPEPYRREHDDYIRHYEDTGERRAIGRIREVEGRRKSGEVFPIELSVSEARLGGDVVYMAILRDVSERRRIQEDLRRERDFAERLIETAQGIVLVLDVEGRIARFNPYMEELSGWKLEEVRGRDWFSTFLPEEDRKRIRQLFDRALGQVEMRGNVNAILTRGGERRDVEWHAKTLLDPSGRVEGILSIGVDITDRLEAARRLAAQYAVTHVLAEAPFLAEATPRILRALGEGVGCDVAELWTVDESGAALRRDGAWYAPGVSREVLDEASRDLLLPRGSGMPGYVWSTGRAEHVEDLASAAGFRRVRAVAEAGLVSGMAFPIRGRQGIIGAVSLFRRERCATDLALMRMLEGIGHQIGGFIERIRADDEVRYSQARFFEFMNHSPAVAFTKDENGRYTWVNRPFELRFDRALETVRGKDDYEIWDAATARAVRASDKSVLAANRAVEVVETMPDPDGEPHQWMTFKFPIRDPTGKRLLAGMAVDVTDRLRAEAKVREMQREAQERERLADIGAITAKIAHDLGNPLGALSMQTQIMVRRAERDASAPLSTVLAPLQQLSKEVRRLESLIRELMSFAREQRLDLRALDTGSYLAEIVEIWKPLATGHGIDLELDVRERAGVIHADPDQLRRVLDNLLKNAIEALAESGGRVRVRAAGLPSQRIEISVEDNGPGIPDEIEPFRLFETSKPTGSGLGLAVSKQIIHAHGGDISWTRLEPRGTAFRMELPSLGIPGEPVGIR